MTDTDPRSLSERIMSGYLESVLCLMLIVVTVWLIA